MSDGKAKEKVKAEVVDGPGSPGTAVEAEAKGWQTRTITFADQEWEIPATLEEADIDVVANLERAGANDQMFALLDGLEGLFGARQFKALKAKVRQQHDGRFVPKMLVPLMEQVGEVYGFGDAGSGG